jgi:hypothetical protein
MINTTRRKTFDRKSIQNMEYKIANEDGNDEHFEIVSVERVEHVHTNIEIPVRSSRKLPPRLPPTPRTAHNPFRSKLKNVSNFNQSHKGFYKVSNVQRIQKPIPRK